MKLQDCFLQQTWRTLRAMARARQLPFDDHLPKENSASRLAQLMVEPDGLRQVLTDLSPEAQAALRALSEADGQMRREVFTARFGSIRPYKPWRDDAPVAPWENPASPAEELAYRGLASVLNQGSKRRPLWVVVLPDEIKTALSPFLEAPMTAPLSPAPPPALPPADISLAILTFLCFLNGEDLKPLHGRWLPPNACRTLAPHLPFQDQGWGRSEHQRPCLRNPKSEIRNQNPGRVRSERQLPYLSFLHYLAERAGLVDLEGEWLKPTLVAPSWLAQSRAERLRTLWEAWREDHEANAELWSRFGLPGDSDLSPLTRFNRLLACLASLSPGDYPLDDLLEALIRRDPALLQPCAPYRIWMEYNNEWGGLTEFRDRLIRRPAVSLARLIRLFVCS